MSMDIGPVHRAMIDAHRARRQRMAPRAVPKSCVEVPREPNPNPEPAPADPLLEALAPPRRAKSIRDVSLEWERTKPTRKSPSPDCVPARPRLLVNAVLCTVCSYYGVSYCDLISGRRQADIVKPRQIAGYLARTLTTYSYPHIGRCLGDRDHTTIISSVRKITRLLPIDPDLAHDVANLTRILTEAAA